MADEDPTQVPVRTTRELPTVIRESTPGLRTVVLGQRPRGRLHKNLVDGDTIQATQEPSAPPQTNITVRRPRGRPRKRQDVERTICSHCAEQDLMCIPVPGDAGRRCLYVSLFSSGPDVVLIYSYSNCAHGNTQCKYGDQQSSTVRKRRTKILPRLDDIMDVVSIGAPSVAT